MKYISTYFDDLTKFVGYERKGHSKDSSICMTKWKKHPKPIRIPSSRYFQSFHRTLPTMSSIHFSQRDALDLEMGFQSLGRTIVESMVQSYIINDILKRFEEPLNDLMQSYKAGTLSYETYMENMGGLYLTR